MAEKKEQKGFLKKFGKWAPIIGGAWIVLNIVAPLALLRIPAVQKYLVELGDKLPVDLPGLLVGIAGPVNPPGIGREPLTASIAFPLSISWVSGSVAQK